MLLDVKSILHVPGAKQEFQFELDLSDMEFAGRYPVSRPVTVEGTVRNSADVLELNLTARTTLDAVCDRCAAEFVREVRYPVEAVLVSGEVTDSYENPWVFELEDGCADLDDIVTTALVLNMPSQLLCKPDCKGLCFRCGANLNLGPCNCKPEPDPRFAALQQLLDKM